mgnify:CR=1 FL=1
MVITSLDNDKVKYYCKLQKKKYRDINNEFVVEGEHLVLEAFKTGVLKEVLLEEGEVLPIDVEQIEVTKEVLKKISTLSSPPKMIGLCEKKIETTIGKRILVVDEIQDPGNLGTIIRSAVAFNIDTIVIGDNTVDVYSPKVIRSTQGMLFHVPIVFYSIDKLIPILKKLKIPVLATNVKYGEEVKNLTRDEKQIFALIVGNEGNGVNPKYLELSDKFIYIPMNDVVESLNVAIATSIILYEMDDIDD